MTNNKNDDIAFLKSILKNYHIDQAKFKRTKNITHIDRSASVLHHWIDPVIRIYKSGGWSIHISVKSFRKCQEHIDKYEPFILITGGCKLVFYKKYSKWT